jgi:hypothetical protein
MKQSYFLVYLCIIALSDFSCTGVKNMSGTLSKSDGKSTEYSRHGDYLSGKNDSLNRAGATQYQPHETTAVRAWESKNPDTYRKDYSKLSDGKSENWNSGSNISGSSVQDYNQKFVSQYAEMDKLADVILYELDILDRRYTLLLQDFKTANNSDRETISKELDKLSADQLTLYRSYTKIYKYGKSDWPRVKSEVDATLLALRGLEKR